MCKSVSCVSTKKNSSLGGSSSSLVVKERAKEPVGACQRVCWKQYESAEEKRNEMKRNEPVCLSLSGWHHRPMKGQVK
jgi:hypothetical protein